MSSQNIQSVSEIEYVFVWSEKTGDEPKPYQAGSHSGMRIHILPTEPGDDGTYPCTADFKWEDLEAVFTCSYQPSTETFADFQILEETAKGGMEDVKSVIISFHRELDGEKISIADENGHLFMFVQMEFGYEDAVPISGDIWGKRALRGERGWWKLTAREKENLQLDWWDEEQREAHFALLKGRKRKVEERAEREWKEAGPVEEGGGAWEVAGMEGDDWGVGWTDGSLQSNGGNW